MHGRFKTPNCLPVLPKNNGDTVITLFWADNFDVNVDKQYGGGAVNTTLLMAFQEGKPTNKKFDMKFECPKSRKLQLEEENITHHSINPRVSPPLIPADLQSPQSLNFYKKRFNLFYNLWLFLRKQNSFDFFSQRSYC